MDHKLCEAKEEKELQSFKDFTRESHVYNIVIVIFRNYLKNYNPNLQKELV
tara:strand:+ start:2489 stop:2641 length:153 start_codon:yes stop_codon:yes gene_type:complete